MPCHRHRSIVSPGYDRESPALSPGLVDVTRHLNDWKMKLPNQWSWRVCGALGLQLSEGLMVHACHVDAC